MILQTNSPPLRGRRSPIGRQLLVLVGAALVGMLLALLWNEHQPARQFQRGMQAVRARDWEGVNYAHLALSGAAGYETRDSLFRGALQVAQRQPEPALEELHFAAKNEATRAAAYELAGEALYAQDNFRAAEASFRRALVLDPDLSAAHRQLAAAYYDVGLMGEALSHLQRLAELEPLDPRPHQVMGVIHMDFGNSSAAVEDFEESLRRGPSQVDRQEMLLELAQCQRQLHRYDDARRTLEACDESAETLALLADVWYRQGEREQARRCAQAALDRAADQRLALLVQGRIAFDERRFDEAVLSLDQAAKTAPTDADIRYSLATALRECGRAEDAAAEMRAADELYQKGTQAQSMLQQAAAEPYNAELRYRLGVLAEELGAPDIAQTWFQATLLLAPGHRQARAKLSGRPASPRDAERPESFASKRVPTAAPPAKNP
ncbi:MAG TPA: tetratricopeptide repeat protein [Pirellulales bacterium]|nr:tetratricopeptide repeat protein [Pirellulales bacterium]